MPKLRTDCRCCLGTDLREVFDLGVQPCANAFLPSDQLAETEPKWPLVLLECAGCGHLQISHVFAADQLYRDYAFQTGTSQRMAEHFAKLMRDSVDRFVPRNGLLVEIGSNDGTALASIERPDVRRLGIDPAENLALIARRRGVPTIATFFSQITAEEIVAAYGRADLIVACNVLAHVDDLDDFCCGVTTLLKADGALIVEVPDVRPLVERTEFDTIYHEHLSYFAPHPLSVLLARHGLTIERVEHQSVHGGSMRLTIRSCHGCVSRADDLQATAETAVARETIDWPAFRQRVDSVRENLLHTLTALRDRGQTVWGYGAPAKGTVLLNYCGITADLVPCVVDSTPTKQGRHVPGTHQFIRPPSELLTQMPDAAIVLAWNHFAEISRKEAAYVARGGTWLIPLPPRIEQSRAA